jgi:two-component system, OmpR family, sensor kinase
MTHKVANSLRARLLLLLFSAIVTTACVQSFIAYRTSLDETNEIFDNQMRQMALSLRPGLNFSGYGSEGFRPDEDEGFEFVVQVSTADRKILFQSSSGTTLPFRGSTGLTLFDDRGTTYKLYTLLHGGQLIQVAQDRAARRSLARHLAIRTTIPITVMAALLLFMVWWVVTSSLAPVYRVQRQISTREADSLDEVETIGLPNEVRPLVEELNLLLRRMRQAFEAQKNFVADAAHELRSPLSALKLQVEQLRRSNTAKDREVAIHRLGTGIDRATRLVEQLLVLARQQASSESNRSAKPIDINRLCLVAFNDVYPLAQQKHIDMGLNQTDECFVMGHEEAIRIMLRNILDNSVKYSPEYSKVDFKVIQKGRSVCISIDDSGPGIPDIDSGRVMDRFYRIPGNHVSGSGLGLSIVKTIADLHSATIEISKSNTLGGLAVRVTFQSYRLVTTPLIMRTNEGITQ